jgi:hypothetical protein
MNKTSSILFLLFVSLFIVKSPVLAQRQNYFSGFEISVSGGFHGGGNYNAISGNVDINNNACYSTKIGFRLPFDRHIITEFEYLGMYTNATLTPYYFDKTSQKESFDISINYFLLGEGYTYSISPTTEIFGMGKFGLAYAKSIKSSYHSITVLAGTLQAGAKFYFSNRVGIRLQAGIYSPLSLNGGGVFIGSGGMDYRVASSVGVIQGDISGGLTIKL